MKNRSCPNKDACWDYDANNCEGCAIGEKIARLVRQNKSLKAENAALRERLSHSLELPYMEQTISRNGTEDTILYYLENGKLQQECFNNKFPEQLQARLAELKGE